MEGVNRGAAAWVPSLPQLARNLNQINKIALVAVVLIAASQIPGSAAETWGECIHSCKIALFKGANNFMTNGACGALCHGVKFNFKY